MHCGRYRRKQSLINGYLRRDGNVERSNVNISMQVCRMPMQKSCHKSFKISACKVCIVEGFSSRVTVLMTDSGLENRRSTVPGQCDRRTAVRASLCGLRFWEYDYTT